MEQLKADCYKQMSEHHLTENVGIGILKYRRYVTVQKSYNHIRRCVIMVGFINTFLIYVIQFLVIAALSAVAVTIGITMAKKKNVGKASETEVVEGTGKA